MKELEISNVSLNLGCALDPCEVSIDRKAVPQTVLPLTYYEEVCVETSGRLAS